MVDGGDCDGAVLAGVFLDGGAGVFDGEFWGLVFVGDADDDVGRVVLDVAVAWKRLGQRK